MDKIEEIINKLEPAITGKKGLIFDLDGTLLDSMPMWSELDVKYIRSLGYEPEPDFQNQVKMMTILDASGYIKDKFNLDKSPEVIAQEITDIATDFYINKVLIKPNVYEFLQELRNRGYNLVAATANEQDICISALERNGIMKFMDGVVTCSMVGYSKQKPDVYLKACEIAGHKPEDCVIFEDSLFAMNTALKAGFTVVGVYDYAEREYWDEICKVTQGQVMFDEK